MSERLRYSVEKATVGGFSSSAILEKAMAAQRGER